MCVVVDIVDVLVVFVDSDVVVEVVVMVVDLVGVVAFCVGAAVAVAVFTIVNGVLVPAVFSCIFVDVLIVGEADDFVVEGVIFVVLEDRVLVAVVGFILIGFVFEGERLSSITIPLNCGWFF